MSDRTAQFQQHRPLLQGIAYRMLGSRADAGDMVQEAYLRWHGADPERVQTRKAWLIATTTGLCIDRLRKARVEREAYIGPSTSSRDSGTLRCQAHPTGLCYDDHP